MTMTQHGGQMRTHTHIHKIEDNMKYDEIENCNDKKAPFNKQ